MYRRKLIDILKSRPGYKRSGHWHSVRCPVCGDSKKSDKHHLFIRISEQDENMLAKCFQPECNVGYKLNSKLLILLGVRDEEILIAVDSAALNNNFNFEYIRSLDNIYYPKFNETVLSYIKSRTGLSEDELFKFKIVGDIEEFIKTNEFKNKENIVKRMKEYKLTSSNCLGIVNEFNTRVQIRKLNTKTFTSLELVRSNLNLHSHYVYKNINDECLDIDIVLTEGMFDMINAVELNNNRKGIYISTCTASAIYGIFREYSTMYHYVNWIIYSDDDVSKDFYDRLYSRFSYRIKSMVIRYNTAYKDIGDKRKPIKISEYTPKQIY